MKHLIVLLALALGLSSCAESSVDPGDNNNGTPGNSPKAGSWYRFEQNLADATFTTLTPTGAFGKSTVMETGMQYEGKTGVMRSQDSATGVLGYVAYEANGNAYQWQPTGVFQGQAYGWWWAKIPVTGGSASNNVNTTINGYPLTSTHTLTNLGNATITVGGKSYDVQKIESRQIITCTTGPMVAEQELHTLLYWAPTVKNAVRSDITNSVRVNNQTQTSTHLSMVLADYELK